MAAPTFNPADHTAVLQFSSLGDDGRIRRSIGCGCGKFFDSGVGRTENAADEAAIAAHQRHVTRLRLDAQIDEQAERRKQLDARSDEERARIKPTDTRIGGAALLVPALILGLVAWLAIGTFSDSEPSEDSTVQYDDAECNGLAGYLKHDSLTNDEAVEGRAEYDANC